MKKYLPLVGVFAVMFSVPLFTTGYDRRWFVIVALVSLVIVPLLLEGDLKTNDPDVRPHYPQ